MSKGPTPFSRSAQFFIVALFLTVCFVFVLIRLAVIQWLQHGKWDQLANAQHERTVLDQVDRGTVYDRNGRILAINVSVPSIYAISDKIENPKRTAKLLAPVLNIPSRTLVEKFKREKHFVWVARKIKTEQFNKIEQLDLPGIDVITESKRFYPKRSLFGHLIGFVGMDNNGLEGVEHKYDRLLRGKEGKIVVVRDAHGNSIYPKGFDYIAPLQGENITLTLDETIQYISARALRRGVEKANAKSGIALVMDPHSGAILSMAGYPPFDPNEVVSYKPSQWRNRAITDIYEPGSTLKIVTAAAALEEKVVSPSEIIDCENGTYVIAGTTVHDHEKIGKVAFYDVIAKSSNIGTIKVATRLGNQRLASYMRAFGFGSRRGIDLTGESAGLLRATHLWSDRSLPSIAIGQEIGVTALQMTSAASVIANNGYLVTPYIVHNNETQGKTGKVISAETAKTMTQILEQVVRSGTGRLAAIPGFKVAGKTGTAQKIDPVTGLYSQKDYVTSFVGFVPAYNPVLTILVMIDAPADESTGGEIAAPVFSDIGREVLHYLKIRPDESIGVRRLI
jgi:cell division protein FtsI (penicillin-binding protein 3)